jgi:peptide deformylase
MILPVIAYGSPVLKKKGIEINKDYPKLDKLLENMWETMYAALGVGLAAPQIGLAIRLFIIDADSFSDEEPSLAGFKKTFINPQIIEESGEEWDFNEGCLSIPDIREDVSRMPKIKMRYQDENFDFCEEVFEGLSARVIQHEYDHIEGILFTDHLSPIRKRMLKGKLANIEKGNISVDYRMKFPLIKKGR